MNSTKEIVYTIGPGLRMAIIFVSFVVTLSIGSFAGYKICKESVKSTDKANQVEVLKSDTAAGLQLVEQYFTADDELRKSRIGRNYEDCANKRISDIIK